jgi:hypothetical protein
MSLIMNSAQLATEEVPSNSTTGAAADSLASEVLLREESKSRWQDVIDKKLIEWGRNPQQVAEDDLIPPTARATNAAVGIAVKMRDQGFLPPLRVVPDGDGGIVLERWEGAASESIEICHDGSAEFVQCRNHRVVQRLLWPTE